MRFDGDTLVANTWSGFALWLNPATGQELRREFTKQPAWRLSGPPSLRGHSTGPCGPVEPLSPLRPLLRNG
jgi:hypothetical protein